MKFEGILGGHERWVRNHKRKMFSIVFLWLVVSFILGYCLCVNTHYEYPMYEVVCFEGYHARPLCGHYVEFIDTLKLKEN